jgi:DNA-binding FadR family transcriptional regulator
VASTAIPPLSRRSRSVSAEVAAHLERLISSGSLAPGERLPSERELSATLQVSRATVREALTELEAKRLVVRQQGRGSTVAAPDDGGEALRTELGSVEVELRNATELRDLVEPRIAALAAQRAAESNILQLEDIVAQTNENLSADESLRLDREFHTLLAHAAQNPLLVTLSEMTSDWTSSLRARSHATRRARRVSLEGHREILDAVAASDPVTAEEAMTRHLHEVRALIAADATSID